MSNENGNSTLTPDEKGKLAGNLTGYDISPDMVRLSLVNMYLHGFAAPNIHEYDTLTSQERWNEYADVILANPPFMSPKGGIRPHNRFSVQSKRSEVLFVDYMAEHLTPSGRAGIIVPEGIIFQGGTAYKRLRKMLVEEYLVAVVSLPAGVFNPYSGVKTSILILDKSLAKRTGFIGFFKVENDGFNLGAQRRPIDKNDLHQVQEEIAMYLDRVRSGQSVENDEPAHGLIVAKQKIAANGEYNLSGERYREGGRRATRFAVVRLGDVAEVIAGQSPPGESYNQTGDGVPFYQGKTEFGEILIGEPRVWTTEPQRFADAGDILMSVRAPVGPVNLATQQICIGRGLAAIKPDTGRLMLQFAFYFLRSQEESIKGDSGTVFASINRGQIEALEIPLPPLEVQEEIVAEIEGYQKVIDGARAVVENYKPHIQVDPEWPMVKLGEVCEINPETVNPEAAYAGQGFFHIDITSVENGTGRFMGYTEIVGSEAPSRARRVVRPGDVLLSTVRPNLKAFTLLKDVRERAVASTGFAVLRSRADILDPVFLLACVSADSAVEQMVGLMGKGAYPSINQSDVASIRIPLPPLTTQKTIAAEIEEEQALVTANRELITRMEKRIQDILVRVWGEE